MELEARFRQLEQDLQRYNELMAQAADTIKDQNVSSYPIFLVHQQEEINMGIPLVVKEGGTMDWSIHASSLEELVTKNIIGADRVDNFRQIYKDPASFLCLFVLTPEEATFVFLPRK